jgi:2-dehydro-3-deoxyglucarate aldolase/4-hydroxy-2-oxoheptanedioate aldolase
VAFGDGLRAGFGDPAGFQGVGNGARRRPFPGDDDSPYSRAGVATYNRACRFGLDPAALDRADTQILTIVQIQSARAVEQADDIAKLDGVDVLFVGPRDLSHDLGVPGDIGAPGYRAALERVRDAAARHGKACGLLVSDGAAAAESRRDGWAFVAVGSDTTLLAAAVSAQVRQARSQERGVR